MRHNQGLGKCFALADNTYQALPDTTIKLNLKIVLTRHMIIAEPQRLMAGSRKKGQEANREKKIYEKKKQINKQNNKPVL